MLSINQNLPELEARKRQLELEIETAKELIRHKEKLTADFWQAVPQGTREFLEKWGISVAVGRGEIQFTRKISPPVPVEMADGTLTFVHDRTCRFAYTPKVLEHPGTFDALPFFLATDGALFHKSEQPYIDAQRKIDAVKKADSELLRAEAEKERKRREASEARRHPLTRLHDFNDWMTVTAKGTPEAPEFRVFDFVAQKEATVHLETGHQLREGKTVDALFHEGKMVAVYSVRDPYRTFAEFVSKHFGRPVRYPDERSAMSGQFTTVNP